jgi:TonB family protein
MAGAITAAMRAARVDVRAHALRVARVERGRIVEERVLRETKTLEGARLVRAGERWMIELAEGATARVADAEGVRTCGGGLSFALANDARGRLVVGEVTYLFQVVVPAPRSTAPLPLSVLARAERVDLRFAAVAAVSLLVHFGFVGAVQADFMDPTVDDAQESARLIVQATSRPFVVQEEKATEPNPEPSLPTSEPPTAAKPAAVDAQSATATTAPVGPGRPAPASLDALNGTLDALTLATLGSMQKGGPPKPDPTTTAPDGALDEVAKKQGGTELDGPALKTAPGGAGPIAAVNKPGWNVGETKIKPLEPPKAAPSAEPTVKPSEPLVLPPGGDPPEDVDSTIARNRWRFRACYAKELAARPDAAGTVKVKVSVADDGTTADVTILSSDFSSTLNACMQSAFTAMKFKPAEKRSVFTVPVQLTQAR